MILLRNEKILQGARKSGPNREEEGQNNDPYSRDKRSRKKETITFAPRRFQKRVEKGWRKGGEIGSLMLSRDARHKARCAPSWVSFLFVPPANLWRADGVA